MSTELMTWEQAETVVRDCLLAFYLFSCALLIKLRNVLFFSNSASS